MGQSVALQRTVQGFWKRKNKKEGQPLLFAQLYESLFVVSQLPNIFFHDAEFAFQCRYIRFHDVKLRLYVVKFIVDGIEAAGHDQHASYHGGSYY